MVVFALFTDFLKAFNLAFRKTLWKAAKPYDALDKTGSI